MYTLNILIALISLLIVDTFAINSFCIKRETIINHVYNFTSLMDPTKDIALHDEYSNEIVWMQLCSELTRKCNGKDGYGICLIRNQEEKGIGKIPPKVTIESGKIMFNFTGDDCTPKVKYTANVIMKCDYAAGNNSYPDIFPHTKEQCNLFMMWKTPLACGPRIQKNCNVTDQGLHYDLSPLTRYSENYVIHTGNRTSPKIILNVCHSVIFEYNALCQMNSGACLQDSTRPGLLRYTNLGEVQQSPIMEAGKLKIVYQEGDMCKIRNITLPHIKTTISFICDIEALDTIPEYVRGSEECHYQLIWKTAAACSIESLRNHSASMAGKCTVTNPLTNFTYDLQALMKEDFYTVAKNNKEYKFGICRAPTNVACKSTAGVCLTKDKTSMGKFNTNLMWQEGGPFLNYTGGDLCENGQQRYTIIAFVCGAEGSSNVPLIMEDHPCQLIIYWNTELVCEKRVKCATDDDEINLYSLIKSTDNYVVKVNSTEFHINICRPLVMTPGLTCAHGGAVCKTSLSSSNEFVNETSLGFPKESPVLNGDRLTVLKYFGGSPCPENPNRLISTIFTFPCRYNDKGYPVYKKYEDCTYNFEWQTSITCGAVMGNWMSPCIIRDQLLSHQCNLSLLYKDQPIHYVKNRQNKKYSVSVCGGEKFCNGSAVCQEANGYGSLTNVIFDYSRDVIKLQYSNGDKCINSSYTSEIRFICNESVGVGEPKLLWESTCTVELEWHTSITCACQTTASEVTYTKNHGTLLDFTPSRTGAVAGIVLTVIALLAAIFYFRDPNRRACLRSCLNPFSSRRGGGRVQYCRVNTTEEARLLLDADPTQCQTDSDDDLLNA